VLFNQSRALKCCRLCSEPGEGGDAEIPKELQKLIKVIGFSLEDVDVHIRPSL